MNNRKHELFNVSFGVWPMYLAPFILVFFAAINLERYMDVFSPVNWLMAAVLEILGLQAVNVWIRLKTWNDEGNVPPAPEWLAAVSGVVYFITSGVIVVLVQVRPDLAVYAKSLFVLIVFSSSVNGALSKQQDRRERSLDAERAADQEGERWRHEMNARNELERQRLDAQSKLDQQRLRQEFRLEQMRLNQDGAVQAKTVEKQSTVSPNGSLNERIRAELDMDSTLSIRELAKRVGAAPSTVHARIKSMIALGEIETDQAGTAKLEVVK